LRSAGSERRVDVDRWRYRGAAHEGWGWAVYARSTTIQADQSSIDAGVAHVRDEVLPALKQLDGFIGLSMMVDRESGRCIATSAWQSEDAMRASADQVQPVRERAAEILGGSPEVEEWEIAVMHRDHPTHEDAWVRSAWLQTEPGGVEGLIDSYKVGALPQIEGLDGFCSASFMVNRASGRAVSSTCFESRAALDASREQADRIRSAGTQQANASVQDVSEFELAVAHLRVPELV
jgi:heme-degrading monooxygenase HmoA